MALGTLNVSPPGDEWLGCVPKHWDIAPLKRWVGVNEAVLPETTDPDCEFSYLEIGAVSNGQLVDQPRQIHFSGAPSRARRIVRQNDTIISTVRTYLKAVWFAGQVDEHLICSTGFAVLTPRGDTNPKFVSYLVRSELFTDHVTAESIGTAYPAISEGRLGSFHVCVPPLDEQAVIVRYLDYADNEIQRYISAKERLTELLTEQRQGIINQAVTRGLDPNVPLKPSGVEWLGDVPAHWEVARNGRLFVQRNETGFPDLPILEVSLRTGVAVRHFGNSDRKQIMSVRSNYKRAAEGDLTYNMMRMWQGAVGVAPVDGLVSPAYVVAKPMAGTESRFFSALFRTSAYMAEVDRHSRGIVKDRNRLYWEDFKQMTTICPPHDEQVDIVAHLTMATEEVDTAIAHARRQIDLMQEYRTRLIADVVTGKLDVRNAMDESGQVANLVTAGSQHLEVDVGR